MTSMIVNGAFAPTPAIPVSPVIVYKERPLLEQIDAKEVAREILDQKSFRCLTKLLGKESAWRATAKNPKSSARGIGQLLEGTYRNLGMKHSQASVPQLVATLAYISRRYGSGGTCAAWTKFQQSKWY